MSNKRRHTELVGVDEILRVSAQSGTIRDRWGNALTLTAMDTFKYGEVRAMEFNGNTSKVNCGVPDTLVGDISAVAWIYPRGWGEGSTGRGRIIDNGQVLWAIYGFSGGMLFRRDGVEASPTGAITLDMWQQVAIVSKANGDSIVYVDTVPTGAEANKGTPAAGGNIIIGNNTVTDRAFDGLISDVRIIDGLLTAQEISQLWSNEKKNYQQ